MHKLLFFFCSFCYSARTNAIEIEIEYCVCARSEAEKTNVYVSKYLKIENSAY